MKRTVLSVGLFASLMIFPALAQTGGGGAAGGGAAAGGASAGGAAGATVGGAAGAGANVAVPPVREPLPPTFNGQTIPNQGATVPGTGAGPQGNGSVNGGNASAGANANTPLNGGGTNSPGQGTNQLTPASRSDSATNRVYWTNRFNTNMANTNAASATNRSGLGPQDMAATEFDRMLIIRARATIIQRLGGTPAAWAPVTFNSDNGAVTVAGAVPSVVIKQRVIAMLQTFPGVVRVTDQLQVDVNLGANAGTTVGATPSGTLQPAAPGALPGTRTNGAVLTPTGRVPSGFRGIATNSTPVTTP